VAGRARLGVHRPGGPPRAHVPHRAAAGQQAGAGTRRAVRQAATAGSPVQASPPGEACTGPLRRERGAHELSGRRSAAVALPLGRSSHPPALGLAPGRDVPGTTADLVRPPSRPPRVLAMLPFALSLSPSQSGSVHVEVRPAWVLQSCRRPRMGARAGGQLRAPGPSRFPQSPGLGDCLAFVSSRRDRLTSSVL